MSNALRKMILLVFFFCSAHMMADEMWNATEIRTSIQFYEQVWHQFGFEILEKRETANNIRGEGEGFSAKPISELFFYAPGGDFEVFSGGIVYHQGGYELSYKGQSMSLMDFEIRTVPNSFHLDIYGPDNLRWFIVTHAHTLAQPGGSELTYKWGDMTLAPELAARLGLEPFVGQAMGILDMVVTLDRPIDTMPRGGCTGNFEGDVDVVLTELSAPSQLRTNGTVITLSAAARLANHGTADVPWYNAIAPSSDVGQHPYLVQHFYVEHEGIFRMLGQSDIKHAFFSVNSECACPGGHILYVGCSDLYGSSTNVQQFYLAPRTEVDPLTGNWKSQGSHFDGDPADNMRDHGGSEDHPDPTTHTLTVDPADLGFANARYWMEGWYIVQGDINIDNSFAYREVTPSNFGASWSFSSVTDSINGQAIVAWADGDPNATSERVDTGKGRMHIASKVTELGGGVYRYSYAILNIDYRAGVRSLEFTPFEPLADVTTQFFDLDDDQANDWQVQVGDQLVSFEMDQENPILWGTVYTMVVDSRNEPRDGQVTVRLSGLNPTPVVVPAITPGESCLTTGEFEELLPSWTSEGDIRDLVQQVNRVCVAR